MVSSKRSASKDHLQHCARRKTAWASIGINAHFDDDEGGDESAAARRSKCGAARHCEECDPYAQNRERELSGLERNTKLRRHRRRLLERIRRVAFLDVHHRTVRTKAGEQADFAAHLDKAHRRVDIAVKQLLEGVHEALLSDERDAVRWIEQLHKTVTERIRLRVEAARHLHEEYSRLSVLTRKDGWTPRVVGAVRECIETATKELRSKELARAYVALLLIEIGLLPRSEEPNIQRLAKRLDARLYRSVGRSVGSTDAELATAIVQLASSAERQLASGSGLPVATSPGLPLSAKWRTITS